MPHQCSIPDCLKPLHGRIYCELHYRRWCKHGNPLQRYAPRLSALARFFRLVEFTDSCWLWRASKDRNGYGQFHPRAGMTRVPHRWLYEQLVCHLPGNLTLDHLCRVRHCVNIFDHAEPVTQQVNIQRGIEARA